MTNEQVIKKIKGLKNIQPRSEWVATNREFLLSHITPGRATEPVRFAWYEYGQVFTGLFRQRLLEPAVVMLLVLGFSVGSSLVVNASFYSLPGDNLYPVKLALENAQVAITPNEERKVKLKIEFVQKRINEFDKIVSQTDIAPDVKKDQLSAVVKEFEKNVAAVQQHIGKIDTQVPDDQREKTLRIAVSISSEAKELARSLDEATKELSAEQSEVKQIATKAVETVQAVGLSADQLLKDEATATTTDQTIEPASDTPSEGEVLGQDTQATSTAGTAESEADNQTTPDLLNL